MVIMHNLEAMNGNRMLGINDKKKASVTEKLASGYQINRAADDAAGLAISEKASIIEYRICKIRTEYTF